MNHNCKKKTTLRIIMSCEVRIKMLPTTTYKPGVVKMEYLKYLKILVLSGKRKHFD